MILTCGSFLCFSFTVFCKWSLVQVVVFLKEAQGKRTLRIVQVLWANCLCLQSYLFGQNTREVGNWSPTLDQDRRGLADRPYASATVAELSLKPCLTRRYTWFHLYISSFPNKKLGSHNILLKLQLFISILSLVPTQPL